MKNEKKNTNKRGFIGGMTAAATAGWLILEAMKAVVYFFTFQFLKKRFKKDSEEKDADIFKKS